MALTKRDLEMIDARIELGVRRYFDHYLEVVFPKQAAALEKHADDAVAAHDSAGEAHGGSLQTLLKFRWLLMGAMAVGGGAAVGVEKLLSLF